MVPSRYTFGEPHMSTSIPSFNQYRVAAIQYEPTLGEKEKNVTALLRLVEEAAQHNARLIVLPEMATTGYCWESRSEVAPYVEPIPGCRILRIRACSCTAWCGCSPLSHKLAGRKIT